MLRLFLCLLFSIFLITCKSSHCIVDKTAIKEFEKNYNIIKSAEETHTSVYVDDYRNALLFLTNVSGIASRAEYSSTIGYRNKALYKKDMSDWKTWLDRNRCKLTQHYIDSSLAQTKH